MCDLRTIKAIRLTDGTVIDTEERFWCFHCPLPTEAGLYRRGRLHDDNGEAVIACGSDLRYFDGIKWLKENEDYTAILSPNSFCS